MVVYITLMMFNRCATTGRDGYSFKASLIIWQTKELPIITIMVIYNLNLVLMQLPAAFVCLKRRSGTRLRQGSVC